MTGHLKHLRHLAQLRHVTARKPGVTDSAKPTFSGYSIDATGLILTWTASEPVTISGTITLAGTSGVAGAGVVSNGGLTITAAVSPAVLYGDTVTISLGAGYGHDLAGNATDAVVAASVTNNAAWTPAAAGSVLYFDGNTLGADGTTVTTLTLAGTLASGATVNVTGIGAVVVVSVTGGKKAFAYNATSSQKVISISGVDLSGAAPLTVGLRALQAAFAGTRRLMEYYDGSSISFALSSSSSDQIGGAATDTGFAAAYGGGFDNQGTGSLAATALAFHTHIGTATPSGVLDVNTAMTFQTDGGTVQTNTMLARDNNPADLNLLNSADLGYTVAGQLRRFAIFPTKLSAPNQALLTTWLEAA